MKFSPVFHTFHTFKTEPEIFPAVFLSPQGVLGKWSCQHTDTSPVSKPSPYFPNFFTGDHCGSHFKKYLYRTSTGSTYGGKGEGLTTWKCWLVPSPYFLPHKPYGAPFDPTLGLYLLDKQGTGPSWWGKVAGGSCCYTIAPSFPFIFFHFYLSLYSPVLAPFPSQRKM